MLGTASACGPAPATDVTTATQSVVVGEDDRLDVYAIADATVAELARQTAVAIVPPEMITEQGGRVELAAPTLQEAWNLCPDVRFAAQPSAAVCSGLLVAPDLVLTAGHCVRFVPCEFMRLVTRFYYESENRLAELTLDDVYHCAEIVAETRSAASASERLDFAWVRLDREVPDVGTRKIGVRDPVEPFEPGESLLMFGFPSGLPLKVDTGARVLDPRAEILDYFVASTDSFHASSGSPLFDAQGRLVGVQSRGGTDYAVAEAGCSVSTQVDEDALRVEEEATYAFRAMDALCELPDSTSYCSGQLAPGRGAGEASGCSSVGARTHRAQFSLVAAFSLLAAFMYRSRRTAL